MKLLFETSLAINNDNIQLTVFETVENSFFAESTQDSGLNSFHFHRMKSEWVSDDPAKQSAAEELGRQIDANR